MRFLADPVTWEEELRYIFLHDVLLIVGITAAVAAVAAILIAVFRKKKRGKQK